MATEPSDPGDPEVRALMQAAHEEGLRLGALQGDDLQTPVLVFRDELGRTHTTTVDVPGVHPADAMRVVLAALKAVKAAICFESWMVEVPPGPEVRAAQEAGVPVHELPVPTLGVPPSEHPDRVETLTVLGQARDRPIAYWSWTIIREAGRPRRFERNDLTGLVTLPRRFNPMFGRAEEIRALARKHLTLARLRNDVRGRRS